MTYPVADGTSAVNVQLAQFDTASAVAPTQGKITFESYISTPAAEGALATVTVVVVDRTLARPRSLAATAWRVPSFRRPLLMSPILRSRTRKSLHEPSGRAMSPAGSSRAPAAEATQAT